MRTLSEDIPTPVPAPGVPRLVAKMAARIEELMHSPGEAQRHCPTVKYVD